jgi:hypothetical protein
MRFHDRRDADVPLAEQTDCVEGRFSRGGISQSREIFPRLFPSSQYDSTSVPHFIALHVTIAAA